MDRIKSEFINGQCCTDKKEEKIFYQFYKNPELLKLRLNKIYTNEYLLGQIGKIKHNKPKSYKDSLFRDENFFIKLLEDTASSVGIDFKTTDLYIQMIYKKIENRIREKGYNDGYFGIDKNFIITEQELNNLCLELK